MSMTKSQSIPLAKFIEAIRPDWNFHGIQAALAANAHKGNAADLAVAMITAAATDANTPAAVVNPVYWPHIGPKAEVDRAAQYRADVERARYRQLKGEADRAARQAATPEQIRAIRAQLTGGTTK